MNLVYLKVMNKINHLCINYLEVNMNISYGITEFFLV